MPRSSALVAFSAEGSPVYQSWRCAGGVLGRSDHTAASSGPLRCREARRGGEDGRQEKNKKKKERKRKRNEKAKKGR